MFSEKLLEEEGSEEEVLNVCMSYDTVTEVSILFRCGLLFSSCLTGSAGGVYH